MNCSNCGTELTPEMFSSGMCFSCGQPTSESEKDFLANQKQLEMEKKHIEEQRKMELAQQKQEAENLYAETIKNHMLTTGFSFEGYHINGYLGIVSGEMILGTGYFSDIDASISDFFGVEAAKYSQKLRAAKQAVLKSMIKNSTDLGGNAIIGISFELMTFSGNMIGVSGTGTSVNIDKN